MKTVGRQSALAHEVGASRASAADRQSPERSASATSGAYLRAPRPSESEAASAGLDEAKLEGLRFELEVGVWRADSERIARGVIDDAEHVPEADVDEE